MRRVISVPVRSPATLLRVLALVVLALATLVAASGISAAAEPGSTSYELVTGRGIPLAQAGVLRDNSAIYVSPAEGIARVRYYLNPSARDLELSTVGGKPAAIATEAPFAWGGRKGFDTKALAGGSHTLVAAIDLVDGRTVVKTARGQVWDGGQALLFEAVPSSATVSVGEQVAPNADCAPLDCSQVKVAAPYFLSFAQDHGGLPDKNGVGTGFTWVDKPTAGGLGYIPANLEVNTVAGLFNITTTGGIAYLADNNQDNALGVGIDAASQVSVLDTKLVNLPALVGDFEQAGLWYGANDDNYLKLVVIYEPGGQRVQFLEERNGVVHQQVVSPVISVSGATVQLRMHANPVNQTLAGYYSLNDGPFSELSTFTVLPALFNGAGAVIDPALGTSVFGGVFATDRFLQGVALFQFDHFSLTTPGQALRVYLPLVVK
jgi:hypothetical protein